MTNFIDDLISLLSEMTTRRYGLQDQLKELDGDIQVLERVIAEMRGNCLVEPTSTDNPYPTQMYVE